MWYFELLSRHNVDADPVWNVWWWLRGWRFVYCFALSGSSTIVSIISLIWPKHLFWWAVVDYHMIGLWFSAPALLLTATDNFGENYTVVSCSDCFALRGAWSCSALTGCSWLLSFVVMVHYYRKGKKAA